MSHRIPIAPLWLALAATVPHASCTTDRVALPVSDVPERAITAVAVVDRNRAADRYVELCAQCHGREGRGDGWEPIESGVERPRSFHDAERMDALTPMQSFDVITAGVEDDKMPAFSQLPDADRWGLAFLVHSLRYDQEAALRGRMSIRDRDQPLVATPPKLALISDGELTESLATDGASADDVRDRVAYLRRIAAHVDPQRPMAHTRTLLSRGVLEYRSGDHAKARRTLARAHLDAFRAQAPALRIAAPRVEAQLDAALRSLRDAASEGVTAADIQRRTAGITEILDFADNELTAGASLTTGLARAGAVTLGTMANSLLLLLLLIAAARRKGALPPERRAIVLGIVIALLATLVTALLWPQLSTTLNGSVREGITAVVFCACAAIGVALVPTASRMFHSAADQTPERSLAWAYTLGTAALLYTDALQIIPAAGALAASQDSLGAVITGCLVTMSCALLLIVFLVEAGKRLSPAQQLAAIGGAMCVACVMASGRGVRAIQDLRVLGESSLGAARSPWLGFSPTVETVASQLLVAAAMAVLLAWHGWRWRRGD